MHTEVIEAGPFERRLTVHIEEPELEDAKNRAARKLSQQMKIKGFRPGKAPRSVVERMVGADALRSEAIDEALPTVVGDAIVAAELDPAVRPMLEAVRDAADGGVEVDVKVTLWPTLDAVPVYAGRKITIDVPEVEEDELEAQIDRFRAQFAGLQPVSREGDEGDFVLINLTALRDGAPVDDASADDLLYEIGSRSFIPGLDALLVGASSGDIREGPATLPEGFGDDAGAEVNLRVLVKEVRAKKLPDIDDEWVADVSEFETVEELRDALTESLRAMKLSVAGSTFRERLVDELTAEMDLELPDALVEAEMESNLHTLAHRLGEQGIDLANYLRITGQDQEAFTAELRAGATKSLRARVLLESVAAAEGIEVVDEDIAGAVATLAAQAGRPTEEIVAALSESGQGAALSGDILRGKAMDRLLEEATPVDADGNAVDLTPPVVDPGDEEPEPEETTPEAEVAPHSVEESAVAAEVSGDDAATKAEEHE